jgi:multidrug efflux pump subunit AcrA (membrane-fusion protein)
VSEAKLEKARWQREAEAASVGDLEQATAEVAAAQPVVAARELDLMNTRLVASFNGMMDECIVAPGQVLSKGAAVSTLVQLDPLNVQCAVSEDLAMRVQPGAKMLFAPAAKPAMIVEAVVEFVSPQIVSQTQRIAARVANHDHQFRPGMTVTVTISLTK